MFAFAPNELDLIDPQMKESEKEQFVVALRVGTGVMIVLLVIAEFLHLWFQSVVFRAYKYTKTIHSSFSPQMQA
ncbi:hypothetical protein DdX_20894 [Ditylenchus destructor]|uniref:Uncharacterized protein n=1 Tax=Ditylenchus destructor TaxID=166010 RepID=A0AAD4MJZ7_9BILA|nr:hypothetical protein DdX_20894 [Ditylenchus destructor]